MRWDGSFVRAHSVRTHRASHAQIPRFTRAHTHARTCTRPYTYICHSLRVARLSTVASQRTRRRRRRRRPFVHSPFSSDCVPAPRQLEPGSRVRINELTSTYTHTRTHSLTRTNTVVECKQPGSPAPDKGTNYTNGHTIFGTVLHSEEFAQRKTSPSRLRTSTYVSSCVRAHMKMRQKPHTHTHTHSCKNTQSNAPIFVHISCFRTDCLPN